MLRIQKQKKSKTRVLYSLLILILIGAGIYYLFVLVYPILKINSVDPKNNSTIERLEKTKPSEIKENRLYIPKIDINVPFNKGDASVMEKGAWWRKPQNGNPRDGGNFILSAHRFIMGLTPEKTLKKSPFYNIGYLDKGDQIVVDFEGKRYVYEITKKFSVKPDSVEIERKTKEPQLTIYSCTFGGSKEGRDVFIGKLQGSGDELRVKKK